jgi:hypothetical protein
VQQFVIEKMFLPFCGIFRTTDKRTSPLSHPFFLLEGRKFPSGWKKNSIGEKKNFHRGENFAPSGKELGRVIVIAKNYCIRLAYCY